jgi:hypothetical protein
MHKGDTDNTIIIIIIIIITIINYFYAGHLQIYLNQTTFFGGYNVAAFLWLKRMEHVVLLPTINAFTLILSFQMCVYSVKYGYFL